MRVILFLVLLFSNSSFGQFQMNMGLRGGYWNEGGDSYYAPRQEPHISQPSEKRWDDDIIAEESARCHREIAEKLAQAALPCPGCWMSRQIALQMEKKDAELWATGGIDPDFTDQEAENNLTRYRILDDRIRTATKIVQRMPDSEPRLKLISLARTVLDYASDEVAYRHRIHENLFRATDRIIDVAVNTVDLATSVLPGVSWARDFYEAVHGVDLFSKRELTSFERNVAVFGVVTVGIGSSAVHTGIKAAEAATPALKLLYQKSIKELVEVTKFFHTRGISHHIKPEKYYDMLNAYMPGAKRHVIQEDLKVYRYIRKGADPKSNWVTRTPVKNPHDELALFHNEPVEMVEFIIPKGTEVLEGTAARQLVTGQDGKQLWREGGANQIYVDRGALR